MICRVCLLNCTEHVDIFKAEGVALEIASIISKHLWFDPKVDDPISNIICYTCWRQLDSFHIFYITVENAHRKLSERVCVKEDPDIKKESSDDVQLELNVVNEESHLSIKSEPDYFDNEGSQQDFLEPVYMECIKYEETVHAEEPLIYEKTYEDHDNSATSKEETGQDTWSLLKEPNEKTDNKDSVEKLITSAEKESQVIHQLLIGEYIKQENNNSDDSSPENSLTQSQLDENNKCSEHMQKSREMDEAIAKHIKLKCDICNIEFNIFAEVTQHFRSVHKRRGYVVCCNKKITNRVVLLDHLNQHFNPDYFKCKECNKVLSNKECLLKHMLRHESDEAKIYKCEKCPQRWAKQYMLDQHKLTHVPQEERKFSCDECGKAFSTNTLLTTHRRYVHEKAYGQKCHICGKFIIGKTMFKKHQLEHDGFVEPKVQCQKCGAWLKHAYGLRKHMQRHNEELSTHVCNICGKITTSQGALRSHVRHVHTERSYQCKLCDKAFKKPINLKEHMTAHTGEPLYTCAHCPKTFNSNSNMYSHKKKVHRKEWEESRRNRGLPPSDSKSVDSETDQNSVVNLYEAEIEDNEKTDRSFCDSSS